MKGKFKNFEGEFLTEELIRDHRNAHHKRISESEFHIIPCQDRLEHYKNLKKYG